MGGSLSVAQRLPGTEYEVTFVDEAGREQREPLERAWSVPFEYGRPVRALRSFKGQKNFTGVWFAASVGRHVGFESWVERDQAMWLDFDREVASFASQPFVLSWAAGGHRRRHVPDYFARLVDGTGVVIDVRPDELVDTASQEQFAAMAEACEAVGWVFRRVGVLDPVMAANLRWLAGYRHERCCSPRFAGVCREVFAEPRPLMAGAGMIGDPIAVLPTLFHLLWRQELTTDVTSRVLGPGSVVRAGDGS
ncbi:TnsA-like heteromeric transposase endonuclease subunit [Actinoallomurus purpureus]|uniref:TnsA-like heteromeric transposase endonuclease subunit n=1 Tax=Actinoallomurus purpureus TaxID=478114 RepID=UPI002092D197|nr:TnsA-like heteromeric transposase endonuclease subunit [Actinoallomurus purpureus]MCO6004031.1 TnsA-like heteromeric transposase endonuclease subunit [Actinoallomurus purpureus]